AVAAAAVIVVGLGLVQADPQGVRVGDIRSALARNGTALRERPTVLSRAVATLAHGTRLRVDVKQGAWIRASTLPASGVPAQSGWLRANQTVEPFALTGAGRRGPVGGAGAAVTQRDLSAAGRQFDVETEKSYRTKHADLARAFLLVDRIEAATPDPEAVERVLAEGRLPRRNGGR
ncbi:MAG: hypothetical protein ACC662_10425, partial [Planctomycetota bacterium]